MITAAPLGGIMQQQQEPGVRTGVLNLLNQIFVTLLGKTPTLLSVKVDVVGPDLEGASLEVGVESVHKVKINTDLVVLQGN